MIRSRNAVVLSMKPRWAEMVLDGRKTVELRRRFCVAGQGQLPSLIYASYPLSSVVGMVKIVRVEVVRPEEVFVVAGTAMGARQNELDLYLLGAKDAYLLFLESPICFQNPVSLEVLRNSMAFVPPVSWRWATAREEQLMEET